MVVRRGHIALCAAFETIGQDAVTAMVISECGRVIPLEPSRQLRVDLDLRRNEFCQ
jgi:hypothetical protein